MMSLARVEHLMRLNFSDRLLAISWSPEKFGAKFDDNLKLTSGGLVFGGGARVDRALYLGVLWVCMHFLLQNLPDTCQG
jgi:hypothetical protein